MKRGCRFAKTGRWHLLPIENRRHCYRPSDELLEEKEFPEIKLLIGGENDKKTKEAQKAA